MTLDAFSKRSSRDVAAQCLQLCFWYAKTAIRSNLTQRALFTLTHIRNVPWFGCRHSVSVVFRHLAYRLRFRNRIRFKVGTRYCYCHVMTWCVMSSTHERRFPLDFLGFSAYATSPFDSKAYFRKVLKIIIDRSMKSGALPLYPKFDMTFSVKSVVSKAARQHTGDEPTGAGYWRVLSLPANCNTRLQHSVPDSYPVSHEVYYYGLKTSSRWHYPCNLVAVIT